MKSIEREIKAFFDFLLLSKYAEDLGHVVDYVSNENEFYFGFRYTTYSSLFELMSRLPLDEKYFIWICSSWDPDCYGYYFYDKN